MRRATVFAAAGLMAIATGAWAAESGPSTQNTTGNAVGRMQGSPNAAGFGKAESTGSTAPAAPSGTPQQDGRMQGPPNASGFNGGTGAPAGAR